MAYFRLWCDQIGASGLKSFESYYHNILPQQNQQFKFYEPAGDMALYAERDLGGWNNIRMAYEVEVCLAYKYRRRMGMPRKARFYLVDTPAISIFDFCKHRAHPSGLVYPYPHRMPPLVWSTHPASLL